jgi:uncharacterized protein (DUF885 family)
MSRLPAFLLLAVLPRLAPAQSFAQGLTQSRVVVDTGLHAFGWTRRQAVDYFAEHAPSESLAEIDRYIAWPAQALSYKIGQLKIRQLRTLAERRLGEKFDIREFHDVLLRDGPLPLDLLEEQVQAWLRGPAVQTK